MRITEIVGSYADREEPEMAWDSSLLRTVANAFTRTGKVKGPLDQQLADGRPIAAHLPFSSQAASDEDPTADATSNTGTDAPMIPTTQILHRSAIRRIGAAPHWPESSFSRSSSFRAQIGCTTVALAGRDDATGGSKRRAARITEEQHDSSSSRWSLSTLMWRAASMLPGYLANEGPDPRYSAASRSEKAGSVIQARPRQKTRSTKLRWQAAPAPQFIA